MKFRKKKKKESRFSCSVSFWLHLFLITPVLERSGASLALDAAL